MNLRKPALSIFRAALEAADPYQAILRHVRVENEVLIAGKKRYPLRKFRHIYVLGGGKASAQMSRAVEKLLGSRIERGLLNTKYGHVTKLKRIELHECGHPVPDEAGVEGAKRIAELAAAAGADDLVICLVSGGASALTPAPVPPITLEEKQATTKLLLASGANIQEINAVRKHISVIKGGQLARLAYPATVLALLLSDVIGDPLDVIGSGPAAPDPSTFADAKAVLDRYSIWSKTPQTIRRRIEAGLRGEVPDTPKPADPIFERTLNLVVGSNRLAVDAAARKAAELGFRPLVLSTFIEGETRDVARMHAAIARQVHATGQPARTPLVLISGGETTVTLKGPGKGGRNQEFVLAAAIDIAGLADTLVLSGGTDGTDGPTDAAGAVADGQTIARAVKQGLSAAAYLADNDSYHFFEKLGDLLITGPTNTNVMDLRLILIG
jgi:hydroxypyruvate reductase